MFRLLTTESRRLLSLARTEPARPMLSVEHPSGRWDHYTAGEMAARITATADFARRGGCEPGRNTVVALPGGEGLVRAVLASWTLGSTPVILPPSATERERDILTAGLGSAFTDAFPLGERELATALERCGDSERTGAPERTGNPERTGAPEGSGAPARHAVTEPPLTWHLPTGGTTGLPRLFPVAPNPAAVLGGARQLMRAAGWSRDAVQLSIGRLSHAAPITTCLAGLVGGAHVVLPRRFHPGALKDAVRRFRPTWCQLTPHQMALLDASTELWEELCSSLTGMLHASAPCPPDVKRRWIGRLGADRVHETYSSTQMTGATLCDGNAWLAHPGTVGRPFPGNEVLVCDPDGPALPAGAVGEVFLRSPWTRAIDRAGARGLRGRGDGFFSVGDTGYLDDDGYLYLTGRLDDTVVVGGAKVNVREVEGAILTHPGVVEAVVVRRPNRLLGEVLHALVVPTDPANPPDLAALREHCQGLLSPYKVPMTADVVPALPRSHADKVQRF